MKSGELKNTMLNRFQGTGPVLVQITFTGWRPANISKAARNTREIRAKKFKGNFFNNRLRNLKMKERAINEQIHKVLRQNKEYCKKKGFKNDGLRKKHHRLHNKLVEVQEEIKKLQPTRAVVIG